MITLTMSGEQNYDDLLFPILHHKAQIADFLDVIFDFLYRRTDFFRIQQENSSDYGLPNGVAEDMVRKTFCKYFQLMLVDENPQLDDSNATIPPPDYISEETVMTTTESKNDQQKESSNDKKICQKEDNLEPTIEHQKKIKDSESEKKVYQSNPECYNGAAYDNYCWSQTVKDVDVQVQVPSDVCSGKQVKVQITQQSLKVEALQEQEWKTLASGDLTWKINVDESTWTLVPNEHIHICLEKIQQRWWDALFVDEPKIDVRSIDASQPYEDLDYDSQTKIQELMYNEHQKRLGKSTVQQSQLQETLREAWDQEGSPFQGTPYNPSLLHFMDADSSSFVNK